MTTLFLFALIATQLNISISKAEENPTFSIEYSTYAVSSSNLLDLRREFYNKNPSGFAATTNWKIVIEGDCDVTLHAHLSIPEHKHLSTLDKNKLAEWNRFINRLNLHEAMHLQNGKSAAREIVKYNCNNNQLIERYWRLKDRFLDLDTQHGKSDGVYLNWQY